jgi:ribose 5-phosphate isomerase B
MDDVDLSHVQSFSTGPVGCYRERESENKIPGIRAGLIHDHFSAQQGVEDDHMNIICMGGRTVGPAVLRTLSIPSWLPSSAETSGHLRRLSKVAAFEAQAASQ